MPMALLPTTMAISAATIGRLIATSEPKAIGQDDDRHQDADQLAVAAGRDVGVARGPPSYSTWMPASRRSWTAFSAASNSAEPDLLGVEADRGERGLPVGADRGSTRVVRAAHRDRRAVPSASFWTACSTAAWWRGRSGRPRSGRSRSRSTASPAGSGPGWRRRRACDSAPGRLKRLVVLTADARS